MAPSSGTAAGFQASAPPTMSSSHPSAQTRVTRPAPPLQHAPGGVGAHHHHHHANPLLFFGPSLAYPYGLNYGFGSLYGFGPLYGFGSPYALGAPYAYGGPYGFGAPYGFTVPYGFTMPYGSREPEFAPEPIYAPFYCSLDGLAFQDEATFARHLHDAHGVPLENALSYAESIGGGRYVFFGF
jgi:hypothetical protein